MSGTILNQYGRPFAQNPLENPNTDIDSEDFWAYVGGARDSESGVRVSASKTLGLPPFWRGVNLITGHVAATPLNLYRRLGPRSREVYRQHPAHRIVRRQPNSAMRAFTLKRTMTLHALLYGNAYAGIFRDGLRRATELVLLDPKETYPAITNGTLEYVTHVNGEPRRLPSRDVLHIRGISYDGLIGVDVITVLADAIGVALSTRSYTSRFFRQGATVSGVLMIPGHFPEKRVRETLEMWDTMASGLAKSHKVGFLQDGVKFQPLTVEAEKAQLLESRKFDVREIANIIGVPPHKLGDDAKTSYNSLEQENQSYLDDGLDTWFCEWESECNEKLLAEGELSRGSAFFEFNRNSRLRTAYETRIDGYGRLREMGVFTADDVAERENLEPIGDNRRYVPSNWQEVGGGGQSSPAAVPASVQNLLTDRLERMVAIDVSHHARAASRDDFEAWAERFWAQHIERMTEALLPVVQVVCDLNDDPRDAGTVAEQFVAAYVGERRSNTEPDSAAALAAELADKLIWSDPDAETEEKETDAETG